MDIKHAYTTGVACIAAVCGISTATAAIISDDFNDGVLNSSLWAVDSYGGVTISEHDGQVHCVMPSNSHGVGYGHTSPFGQPAAPNFFESYYITQHEYAGNFDLTIDYSLINWPQANGTRVNLFWDADGMNTGPQRVSLSNSDWWTSFSGKETYIFGGNMGVSGILNTTDAQGSLRMTRVGDMISGYYRSTQDGSWVLIGQWVAPSASAHLGFAIFNTDELFSHQDVEVAFDNMSLEYDSALNPVPEPATWLAGMGTLAMLLCSVRARK